MARRADAVCSDMSLSGITVLLTRPLQQLAGSRAAVTAAGGRALELPLIAIEPLADRDAERQVKQAVLALDRYDLAIFVSINAVTHAMQWIDQYWPQLPHGLHAFSVGPGTGHVLAGHGWPVSWPEQGVTSEALLAMPQLQQLQGRRVILFRGDGGRELLADSLRVRGAEVDVIALYRRCNIHYSTTELQRLMAAALPDVVVLSSGQILLAWQQLLDALDDVALAQMLRQRPLLLPSERVAQQARGAGFAITINCGGASDECIMACLHERRDQIRQVIAEGGDGNE